MSETRVGQCAIKKWSKNGISKVGVTAIIIGGMGMVSPVTAATQFTANMDDSQEVSPGVPGTTTGTASVDAQLNDLGGGDFSLTIQALFTSDFNFMNFGGDDNGGEEIVRNMHIHNAARGDGGGVVWGVFAPDQDLDDDTVVTSNPDGTTMITTEWDLNEGNVALADFLAELQAATPGSDVNLYLNLHTTEATGGAIRGQFVAVPEPASLAILAAAGGMTLMSRLDRRPDENRSASPARSSTPKAVSSSASAPSVRHRMCRSPASSASISPRRRFARRSVMVRLPRR